jgi:hypothetical protein
MCSRRKCWFPNRLLILEACSDDWLSVSLSFRSPRPKVSLERRSAPEPDRGFREALGVGLWSPRARRSTFVGACTRKNSLPRRRDSSHIAGAHGGSSIVAADRVHGRRFVPSEAPETTLASASSINSSVGNRRSDVCGLQHQHSFVHSSASSEDLQHVERRISLQHAANEIPKHLLKIPEDVYQFSSLLYIHRRPRHPHFSPSSSSQSEASTMSG